MIKILIIALMFFMSISCGTKSSTVDNVGLDTTNPALPILHLNGTTYENGYQHGKLLRKEINELVGLWKQDLEEKYKMPADTFINIFLDSTNYIPSIIKWTPKLLDEVKGISKGSGLDFHTLFAFQLVDEISTNARLIDMPHHCTSVGINNYKKDGSSNIIAQNIDVPPFYHGFEVLLDIKNNNSGTRKLVTTFAGYIGVNGLNRHIGITENSLMDLKGALDGLPVCFISRGVLEKKSFDEAIFFLKNVKHASGQNYIVGSRENIISLECAAKQITAYWPDTTQNYTYHANSVLTNTSYHPAFTAYVKNVFNSTPEAISFGDPRLELMETRILNNKSINVSTIERILSEKPICNHNTWVSTIMEFNSNHNTLNIKPENPDSTAYLVIRME